VVFLEMVLQVLLEIIILHSFREEEVQVLLERVD
jgi:hypothetical protein